MLDLNSFMFFARVSFNTSGNFFNNILSVP
jgi:hypothetical protein